MEKINVVLVVLNEKVFAQVLYSLNSDAVNLIAVVVDNADKGNINQEGRPVQIVPFSRIQELLDAGEDFVWLISGFAHGVGDIWKMKKFLMNSGVPEDNIVNFEILPHISVEWIANLRYVEEYGADFLATGISYTEFGLDLRYIPHLRGRGVNLSSSNQDLQQGYLTAKYVFAHVKPGTIKFVLIGLTPYSFRYDNAESFSVCSRNLQYMLALNNHGKETLQDILLKLLVSDRVKNIFKETTARQADLNFERMKNSLNAEIPARAVIDWEDELKNLTKELRPKVVQKNFQILKDYIELCLDNGAKPVGVVFPFAPVIRKNYNSELLSNFRKKIHQLEKSYDFTCMDMFDLPLGYDCFYNTAHLNLRGAVSASSLLGLQLYEKNFLSTEDLCNTSYDYFEFLSGALDKNDFNEIMTRVFEKSTELIRHKDKIKVGFVLYDSSMWCGDELYNFFAADTRFEPTIFLCLRTDRSTDEFVKADFVHGVKQFQSRGLNVVPLDDKNSAVPAQDVLIFLTPYLEVLPNAFQLSTLTARTLTTYIPYTFLMSTYNVFSFGLFKVMWKIFFESRQMLENFNATDNAEMSHAFYSGYSRMDVFFKRDADLHFDWKMTRPDAKKIIWAPHWSINDGVLYSTFQWNYKFMYEFAKAHPETSWVVKPHSNLLFSAVQSGLFPSREAFKEYLRAWNALPNAEVVTGAYYQAIFATSDGMIQDSSSFIAEYQYVDKPMIYLTRSTQRFNELGKEILKASYTVDGKNLEGIVALMQRVFIEGDDYKAVERKAVFDKYLNYPKANGMSASEFLYKNIIREL